MRINLTSVFVNDQANALDFYTRVLGFLKKEDVPLGEARWLTVVSPEDETGPELLLEPNDNPAAKAYQEAIFEQGIPAAMFAVDDIVAEVDRLRARGVTFVMEPTSTGPVMVAAFEDTCGNIIQIAQHLASGGEAG